MKILKKIYNINKIFMLITVLSFSSVYGSNLIGLSGVERNYIKKYIGKTEWFGLYMGEDKIGYGYSKFDFDSKKTNVFFVELFLKIKMISGEIEDDYSLNEKLYFDKSSNELIGCSLINLAPNKEIIEVVKKEDLWLINNNESIINKRVEFKSYKIQDYFAGVFWILTKPEINEINKTIDFDCGELSLSESSMKIDGIKNRTLLGKKIISYKVETLTKIGEETLILNSNILEDGLMLNSDIDGMLVIRSEPEDIAKNQSLIGWNFDININNTISNIDRLDLLVLKITGKKNILVSNNFNQKVEFLKNNVVTVSVGPLVNLKNSANKDEIKKYNKPNIHHPSDDPRILKLVNQIIGDATNDKEIVSNILMYVSNFVIDDYNSNSENVFNIIESKKGDCTEHTRLFVTLAKAAGISAKEISGLVYNEDDENPAFVLHAWAEVVINGHWNAVDPTWGKETISTAHIKFDGHINSILALNKNLKIEILDKVYKYKATEKEYDKFYSLLDSKDHSGAIKYITPYVNKGDDIALLRLGLIYDEGKGVPIDDEKAVEYYRISANQGNEAAQYNMGLMYRYGEGVNQNEINSKFWFLKAASNGNLRAAYYVAEGYENGKGLPKDHNEAYDWYKIAAEAALEN